MRRIVLAACLLLAATPAVAQLSTSPRALMQAAPTNKIPNSVYVERTIDLSPLNITTWTTVGTIAPATTLGAADGYLLIEAQMSGHTNVTAQGARVSRWTVQIAGGSLTPAIVGTDIVAGGPIQFRVTNTGTTVNIQVQSSSGTQVIDRGVLHYSLLLGGISGYAGGWVY